MQGVIIAVFDWKERDSARSWVRRMNRLGLRTYMAETGRDQYELFAMASQDVAWWQEHFYTFSQVQIRPVTERLDE